MTMMTVTMTVKMMMTVTMPMMMMTILSSGRNSPCLITRVALGRWPEPVSHKNTHHDTRRRQHHHDCHRIDHYDKHVNSCSEPVSQKSLIIINIAIMNSCISSEAA